MVDVGQSHWGKMVRKRTPKRKGNRGVLKEASAVILAGGRSSRTLCDKTMLPVNKRPLIEHIYEQLKPHFHEILISANDLDKYAFLGVPIVPDCKPGQGPLMGIVSALLASKNDLIFAIAADIPEVDISLVFQMLKQASQFDCVIPVIDNTKIEPLFAIYKRTVFPKANQLLAMGERKVLKLFDRVKTGFVEMKNSEWYRNINTIDDYQEYLRRINENN
jgi:molybdopterin-guanine dinucleotide biosynthesis protein A